MRRRPFALAGRAGDQILADFDLDMVEAVGFAVHRDRVVAVVGDRVRFVVADGEVALRPQQLEHEPRERRRMVVQHADLDGAVDALEHRGKAVHRDQHGAAPGGPPRVEQPGNRGVIRVEDRLPAGGARRVGQALVAGDRGQSR